MFIVLEGIDGCGKSTQAGLLAEELTRRGRDVLHLHEPGGTPLGETIRTMLLQHGSVEIHSRAEALLYSAARAELVHTVLLPALAAGKTVVCERYYYSTVAYQGYGLGEDPGHLQAISAYATHRTKPDRVVLLDITPEEAAARSKKTLDRIEARGLDYMHRVRDGYFLLSRREPERVRIVNASGEPADVARRVVEVLQDALS